MKNEISDIEIDEKKWTSTPFTDWHKLLDMGWVPEYWPKEDKAYYARDNIMLKWRSSNWPKDKKSRILYITNIYLKNKKLCRIAGVTLDENYIQKGGRWLPGKLLAEPWFVIEQCDDPTLEELIKEIKSIFLLKIDS